MQAWAVPWLLLAGGLLAVQAAANVQLSTAVRSPFGASTLQLAVGAALLLAATVAAGTLGAFGRLGEVTPWHLLGGLGSMVYITAGILLFPRLGALVTVGLFITGQMLASLLLDTLGPLGVHAEPLRASELVGVLGVLAGAALIVRAQAASAAAASQETAAPGPALTPATAVRAATTSSSTSPGAGSEATRIGWLVLAVLGGAVLPVQGAVNAQLRADLRAPITVAAFSFVLAAAAMAVLLALAVRAGHASRPQLGGLRIVPWWGWLGGLAGAIYVTSVFLLIPRIGAASTIALTVAGQQLAGVVVDQYGLLRLSRRRITGRRLAGAGILLVGVALLQLT